MIGPLEGIAASGLDPWMTSIALIHLYHFQQ